MKKINRFREACRLTKEVMQAACPDSAVTAEERASYESYRQRYLCQLGRKADPAAPTDPKTGKPKHYYRLDNFIRAMIHQNIKAQNA